MEQCLENIGTDFADDIVKCVLFDRKMCFDFNLTEICS